MSYNKEMGFAEAIEFPLGNFERTTSGHSGANIFSIPLDLEPQAPVRLAAQRKIGIQTRRNIPPMPPALAKVNEVVKNTPWRKVGHVIRYLIASGLGYAAIIEFLSKNHQ